MHFSIKIYTPDKIYHLHVRRIFADHSVEQYEITAANGQIKLQTDRPVKIQDTYQNVPFKWEVISGRLKNADLMKRIVNGLETRLREMHKRDEI